MAEEKAKKTSSDPQVIKKEDKTVEIRLVIPWKKVEEERKKAIEELAASTNLPGFRKGKAPSKLIEEKLDPARIREEILSHLLPQAYIEVVRQNDLKPIIDPRIQLDGALEDGKDWSFIAVTCEAPDVNLGNYKEEIQKITSKSKIVVPGKEPEAPKFDEIVNALLQSVKVAIPSILIEREADRLLAQTLDEIKKLGMSLDQYLASTGKTAETLRAEYAQKAQSDLKLEFALQKVAESEKITVDEPEIEKTIEGAKTPEEKRSLQANRYVLASIIRQQKTLDFLKSL
jgi:FKBP-type peptidyl-prolyl cis-trans isomerase (trigger factor)